MQAKKIVIFVAAVLSVLMLLFPPTLIFIEETADQASKFHFEYMFIFSIPEETRINGILLLSQWFGLLLGTALVLSLFDTHSDKNLVPKFNKQDADREDSDVKQDKADQ